MLRTLSCKLCGAETEDAAHFICHCYALAEVRVALHSTAPPTITSLPPDSSSSLEEFMEVMLGMCWIDNSELQSFYVSFLDQFRSAHAHKLLNRTPGP